MQAKVKLRRSNTCTCNDEIFPSIFFPFYICRTFLSGSNSSKLKGVFENAFFA